LSFVEDLEELLMKIKQLQQLNFYYTNETEKFHIQKVVDKIIYYKGMHKFNRVFRSFDARDYQRVTTGSNKKLLDTCERIVNLMITEVKTWSKAYKQTEDGNNLVLKLPFFETPVTDRETLIFVLGLILGFMVSILLFQLGILYIP